MKNILNEEINKMKYLFNYNRGLTLSEQKNVINEDAAPGGLVGDWNPSTGEYTIAKGDTLSKIGKAFGVKWMDIWEENKDTLRSGKPNCGKYCGYNWIFVGEVVTIPGQAKTTTTKTDTTVDDTTVDDTTVDDTTVDDTTATEKPAENPKIKTTDAEPKTKKEIKRDCRDEANRQGLKRFTKERRDFMRQCKEDGGINAEIDDENTSNNTTEKPADNSEIKTADAETKTKKAIRRDCRDEANDKKLRRFTKERRDFMRKCKEEGGINVESDKENTSNNTTTDQKLGNAPQEVTEYFKNLKTTEPYDIVVSDKSYDREIAFKKAKNKAKSDLKINHEPTLVGERKVIPIDKEYYVYAAFKK